MEHSWQGIGKTKEDFPGATYCAMESARPAFSRKRKGGRKSQSYKNSGGERSYGEHKPDVADVGLFGASIVCRKRATRHQSIDTKAHPMKVIE